MVALHDSPYRFVAYMDLSQRDLFGLDGLVGTLKIAPASGATMAELQRDVAAVPGVASALPASAVSRANREMLATLSQMFLILQAVIGLLAFLVAFNASRVAADERRRENATMLAFGIRPRRVLGMEVGESLMLGAAGVLLGLGFGAAMLSWILATGLPRRVARPGRGAVHRAVLLRHHHRHRGGRHRHRTGDEHPNPAAMDLPSTLRHLE